MQIKDIISRARERAPLRIATAEAGDRSVLESLREAYKLGIAEPILIGNKEKITAGLKESEFDFSGEIIITADEEESAHKAMELVMEGKADLPMKGQLGTSVILKAFLDKRYDLRQSKILSLVTAVYLSKEERLVFLTDCGMNIAPGLEEKAGLINNSIGIARALGIESPRVAVLAAVEKVNPAMPVTLEAAALSKMAERGQIKGALIDGPLAFDNAISTESAKQKGIESPVAGKADILILPDIETGNVLYKALITYGQEESASLVAGGKVPLILTSRADTAETRLNSIALAKLVLEGMKALKN